VKPYSYYPYIIIIISLLLAGTANIVYAADNQAKVDVLVSFANPDGWVILAKDGQQIAKQFTVTVYSSQAGLVDIKLLLNDKVIKSEQLKTDFKVQRSYTVPETGALTIQVTFTNANNSITITKSYTVVVQPKPVGPNMVVFGPKQFLEYIHNVKMETVTIAGLFALLGVAAARLLKYNLKMLDPFNGMQLPALFVFGLAAYLADPNLSWAYFSVALVADVIAYGAMHGPETAVFWEIPEDSTEAREVELPIYTTPEGYLAVAFQSVKHAIGRLRGIHIPLKLEGRYKVAWTLNGEHRLFIAKHLSFTEEEVEEIEEKEENPEQTKQRVFKAELADAHDINYLRNVKYFEEVKENCMKLYEENMRYKTGFLLELKKELSKFNLMSIIDVVKPELPKEVVDNGEQGGS